MIIFELTASVGMSGSSSMLNSSFILLMPLDLFTDEPNVSACTLPIFPEGFGVFTYNLVAVIWP